MTKGMIVMEEMKEGEMLQVIMKNIIVLKRSQDTPCMKVMFAINLSIFLFLLSLILLLWFLGIVGWFIVGSFITSLGIRNFSLIWYRSSQL